MATLMQKRLAGLPVGTYIELTYADGQNVSRASGTIIEADEESFALSTSDGEEIVLLFSEVKTFRKKDAAPEAAGAAAGEHSSRANDRSADPDRNVPALEKSGKRIGSSICF